MQLIIIIICVSFCIGLCRLLMVTMTKYFDGSASVVVKIIKAKRPIDQ